MIDPQLVAFGPWIVPVLLVLYSIVVVVGGWLVFKLVRWALKETK